MFNPNIHPYIEYKTRRDTLKEYTKSIGINAIFDENYGLREFCKNVVDDLENRCVKYCYRVRLEQTAKYAKENGYKKFNMGLAPLSNVGESKHAFLNERIAQQLYTHSKKIYSFEGLKRFKEKYCTLWEPRYFAYRKNSNILGIIISFLLKIYLPNKDKSIDSNISSSKDV